MGLELPSQASHQKIEFQENFILGKSDDFGKTIIQSITHIPSWELGETFLSVDDLLLFLSESFNRSHISNNITTELPKFLCLLR